MGRMPYHVHIFPYRERGNGTEFALFQRSDRTDVWQGICGGGESGESLLQSAYRECREEGGIEIPGPLYMLDSISFMRSTVFPEWMESWGRDVIVLPMYFFGMPYEGEITLSEEHLQFRWCTFAEADALMRMPDQNTALWELSQRLQLGNLERPLPPQTKTRWTPNLLRW